MTKQTWTTIREAIVQDIDDGVLQPGARLPTEPELAELYGTGRHSVRRALADLAREGLLSIEQGRGTFVLPQPRIDYTISKRTRLHKNMGAQGIDVAGETLSTERVPASGRAAQVLGLSKGDEMLVTRRLNRADGLPVSFGTIHHDPKRFPEFASLRIALGSTSAVYRNYGIADYLRGKTTVHARPARSEETQMLRQHPDMPVIVVRATDTTLDGTPISFSEVIWSAARVKFTFLPQEDDP